MSTLHSDDNEADALDRRRAGPRARASNDGGAICEQGDGEIMHIDKIEAENAIPFRQHCGIRVVSAADGKATLIMPWQPPIGNRFGGVHGGAIATLIDGAISTALVSALPDDAQLGATIELSIRFVNAAEGDIRGEGRTIRIAGRVAFGQADLYDSEGRLVATGQGTFQIRRRRS